MVIMRPTRVEDRDGLREEASTGELNVPGMVVVPKDGSAEGGGSTVMVQQPQPQMTVQVPPGVAAGQMLTVTVNGAPMQVQVPVGVSEGQTFVISVPPPATAVAAAVAMP